MKRLFIAIAVVCLMLLTTTPALGSYLQIDISKANDHLPYLNWTFQYGNFSFSWLPYAFKEAPRIKEKSDVDITVGQGEIILGYLMKSDIFSKMALEVMIGGRHIYHKREGGVYQKIDEENIILVPVIFMHEQGITPYGSMQIMVDLSRVGLSFRAGISQKGVDGQITGLYEISNGFELSVGYRHYSMDDWPDKYLFGLRVKI